MTQSFTIKQNDLLPVLGAILTDQNGDAVAVPGGATVRFKMRPRRVLEPVIDETATVVDAAAGHVAYEWVDGDTADVGFYEAEFEVTSAGKPTTFPNDGFILVRIKDDIDNE